MKTLFAYLFVIFCLSAITKVYSQVPQAISYQAVARNNTGNPIANNSISLRFSIHDSSPIGTIVYQETHNAATNTLGLFTINIGQGTPVTGTFTSINWGINSKFLQVEMDAAGGTSFVDLGTQQMLSVPYALNAGNGNWNKNGNDIYNSNSNNVGIGTAAPSPSAQLDVTSVNKGFLPPRLTVAQRNAIAAPAAGLQIWCIDCNQLQVYDGAIWQNIAGPKAILPNVAICSQVWMDKNLDVSSYRNGDPIPKVTDPTQWSNLTTGAYCYYNNDSAAYAAVYGKLYNWYAVNDPRGLAPEGWHIPTEAEWQSIAACLGGGTVAGGAMKETGTAHWNSPNNGATNSSGYTALPGGQRASNGPFGGIGTSGYWWSSTASNLTNANHRIIQNSITDIYSNGGISKKYGFSVRCIKD